MAAFVNKPTSSAPAMAVAGTHARYIETDSSLKIMPTGTQRLSIVLGIALALAFGQAASAADSAIAAGRMPASPTRPFSPAAWAYALRSRDGVEQTVILQRRDLTCTDRDERGEGRLAYPTLPWDFKGDVPGNLGGYQKTPLEDVIGVRPATAEEISSWRAAKRPERLMVIEMADGSMPRMSPRDKPVCWFEGPGREPFLGMYDVFGRDKLMSSFVSLKTYSASELAALQDGARRQQVAAARIEQAQLEKFRKALKVGDDTSCGLVVEIKANLVQVQRPDALVWMRRDTIAQPGARCGS